MTVERTVTVARRDDHGAMPWRNGGGTTYEVARWPETDDDFAWRISFAEVDAPGPFSSFAGVDRIITLVSGTLMRLDLTPSGAATGYIRDLHPFEPFAFAGEDAVSATPNGRTLDLNVMTARGRCVATLDIVRPRASVNLERGESTLLVACLDGDLQIGTESIDTLEQLDVARVAGETTLRGEGVAAVIRLSAV